MAEEEKAEGGITVGYILRTIFSQKWLALIIAAAITIVGTLAIYFVGKRGEEYSASFVLQLPNTGDASSTSYTYPDGESFYFKDLVSSENLKAVAAREGFKNIDVEKMVKDIDIIRTVDRIDDNNKDGVYDLNYTIKVKAKYFDDEDEARDFIEALTSIPREHISSMDIDYDQSLTTSKSATTYSEQINLLRSQTQYIQLKYNELIRAHGGEFVINGGKTLAQYKDEIDYYLSQDLFTSLKGHADENGYIKSLSAKYKYEGDKSAKELALKRATEKLKALQELPSSSTIIDGEIIALTGEIGTLKYEISILQKYIDSFDDPNKIAPAEFEAEVAKVEAAVTAFTNGIKPVASYVYGRVTKIIYLSTNVVEIDGGYGIVMSAAVSLVAGMVVACLVAYIVGWNKQKKAGTVKVSLPVNTEVQLQAAAAEASEEEDKKDEK